MSLKQEHTSSIVEKERNEALVKVAELTTELNDLKAKALDPASESDIRTDLESTRAQL